MDQGEPQAQQAQESSKRSLSSLETTIQPVAACPSIPEAGEIPAWLGMLCFIDCCARRGRDLIGMGRFLTLVSGSQQGEAAKVEPSSSKRCFLLGFCLWEKEIPPLPCTCSSWIHPHPLDVHC